MAFKKQITQNSDGEQLVYLTTDAALASGSSISESFDLPRGADKRGIWAKIALSDPTKWSLTTYVRLIKNGAAEIITAYDQLSNTNGYTKLPVDLNDRDEITVEFVNNSGVALDCYVWLFNGNGINV